MAFKTLAEQIGGRCTHFTGMGSDKASCAVGVVYATVKSQEVKGFAGIPCFREGSAVPCDKRRFPTDEEVAKEVAEHDAHWERLKIGIGAASEDAKKQGFKKGKGGAGKLACPVCKTGELHYSVASYNGHMHGRCTTPNCCQWMQ